VRVALKTFLLLSVLAACVVIWAISGVSRNIASVDEGLEIVQEARLAKDWAQVSRGTELIFVAHKGLGIYEAVEDLGLLIAAFSALISFVLFTRIERPTVGST
jgi:hypothetical protein